MIKMTHNCNPEVNSNHNFERSACWGVQAQADANLPKLLGNGCNEWQQTPVLFHSDTCHSDTRQSHCCLPLFPPLKEKEASALSLWCGNAPV